MEELYKIPESPQYSEDIRKLQDTDLASASGTFNPLIERMIENIAALKRTLAEHEAALSAQPLRRHVIAVRTRDPARPDYGLASDTGKAEVLLDTGPITGAAEVSVIVSGVEYDAKNMSVSGENASEGMLILTRLEE